MVEEFEGDIKLEQPDLEVADNGFRAESVASTAAATEVNGEMNTLDEPVSETIKRDLMRIWQKLRIVLNPIGAAHDSAEKRKEIRNWDLWGPFFFCLMLAT